MLKVFCGVGVLSTWRAGRPYKIMGGWDIVVRFVELAAEQVCMGLSLLAALDGRGV